MYSHHILSDLAGAQQEAAAAQARRAELVRAARRERPRAHVLRAVTGWVLRGTRTPREVIPRPAPLPGAAEGV